MTRGTSASSTSGTSQTRKALAAALAAALIAGPQAPGAAAQVVAGSLGAAGSAASGSVGAGLAGARLSVDFRLWGGELPFSSLPELSLPVLPLPGAPRALPLPPAPLQPRLPAGLGPAPVLPAAAASTALTSPAVPLGAAPAWVTAPEGAPAVLPGGPAAARPLGALPAARELGARAAEAKDASAGRLDGLLESFWSGASAKPAAVEPWTLHHSLDPGSPAPGGLEPAQPREARLSPETSPGAGAFPARMLDKTREDSRLLLRSNLRTLALGAVAGVAAALAGASPALTAGLLVAGLALPLALHPLRATAWSSLREALQGADTDSRRGFFPTLFKGERWTGASASLGKLGALAVMDGAGMLAWRLLETHPLVAALALATSLSGLSTWLLLKTYARDSRLLAVSLAARLREGYPVTTDPASVPGETALEKRYWFLKPASGSQPVTTFPSTYRALRSHGLPAASAFLTAALSHLMFGPKTQRGLSRDLRERAGLLGRPFAIYLPHLVQAQSYSNTRIYAPVGNSRGLRPGDVDLEEFERMFRLYAPGRDYMTARDMARMRRGNRLRDAREGRGNMLSRLLGQLSAKRRADQLLALYADRVAGEGKKLVPAVSRELLLRVYQGTAQVDLLKERALDGSAHLNR